MLAVVRTGLTLVLTIVLAACGGAPPPSPRTLPIGAPSLAPDEALRRAEALLPVDDDDPRAALALGRALVLAGLTIAAEDVLAQAATEPTLTVEALAWWCVDRDDGARPPEVTVSIDVEDVDARLEGQPPAIADCVRFALARPDRDDGTGAALALGRGATGTTELGRAVRAARLAQQLSSVEPADRLVAVRAWAADRDDDDARLAVALALLEIPAAPSPAGPPAREEQLLARGLPVCDWAGHDASARDEAMALLGAESARPEVIALRVWIAGRDCTHGTAIDERAAALTATALALPRVRASARDVCSDAWARAQSELTPLEPDVRALALAVASAREHDADAWALSALGDAPEPSLAQLRTIDAAAPRDAVLAGRLSAASRDSALLAMLHALAMPPRTTATAPRRLARIEVERMRAAQAPEGVRAIAALRLDLAHAVLAQDLGDALAATADRLVAVAAAERAEVDRLAAAALAAQHEPSLCAPAR